VMGPVHDAHARVPDSTPSRPASRRVNPSATLLSRLGNRMAPQALSDVGTRGAFEESFGQDFSSVRVSSDPQAARAHGARAYMSGEQIVLGDRPSRALVAHELAHVVQQRIGGGPAGPAHEVEADTAARAFEAGGHAQVALGSSEGAVQRAGPVVGVPAPPSWLNGVNARHVTGNIWEVEFKTGGWHLVGPYRELDAYRRSIGVAGDSHHIVGGEHLLDLNSTFGYENAPAVVLEEGLHERVVTPRIGFEQTVAGGRRGGRPVLTQSEVKGMYRAAYTEQAPFRELSRIAENIVDQSTPLPPATTKAVTAAAQAVEEVNIAGKTAASAEGKLAAGEKSTLGAIKPQALAAEEKALAQGTELELGVAEKPALKGMGLSGGPSPVKLAAAGIGIQIAGELLQAWMYKAIRESVLNMPKPSVTAAHMWRDQATRQKYVPVEVLAANLPQIQEDLARSLGHNTIELIWFWRALDVAPPEQRPEMLDSLESAVLRSQAEVLNAQRNVRRMLELEPQILESVAAARELQAIVSDPTVMGIGVSFVGFDLTDLTKISDNLSWFQASFTRGVLAPLHEIAIALTRAEASNDAVLEQVKALRARTIPRLTSTR
jgi:hypothetical protein